LSNISLIKIVEIKTKNDAGTNAMNMIKIFPINVSAVISPKPIVLEVTM